MRNIAYYVSLAQTGTRSSVQTIMNDLNKNMTLAQSKYIDFALGHVSTDEGSSAIKHYLFHGTQLQRNYCALYFSRLDEYGVVRQAFEKGLIDAKQAFSR